MQINRTRGLVSRQVSFPRVKRINEKRRIIAEVFEDLATETIVELEVYETFLDLNPQVREFPNLNPGEVVFRREERVTNRRYLGQRRKRN